MCGPGRRLVNNAREVEYFFLFCNTPVKSMTLISLLLGRINGLQSQNWKHFGGIAM